MSGLALTWLHMIYGSIRVSLVLSFAVLCGTIRTAAQSSAATPPAAEPALLERLKTPDQAGGLHFTEHFAVAFGGIKQGSGVALGPAYSTTFGDGGFLQLKAVASIKKFAVLQARYDTRRFWRDRALAISRLRWYTAPELSLYRLGPDSPDARVNYAERRTDVSTLIQARLRPRLRAAAGFGIERYETDGGRIDLKEDERALPDIPPVPGLSTHPWFAHSFVSLAIDSRPSTDYPRSGGLLEAGAHDYHDWHDGQASFRRYEGTAQQLVPMFQERGVLDLSARIWASQASGDRSVPFFLMPTLGGGDLLRAFNSYRFRDRNAVLFKGEYRWAVHEMADLAGVYEAGTVAPTVSEFSAADLAHSIALGIRVHSNMKNLFRADVAHGREGFGFRIGFSAGGS